jgi:glycine/D-amino acid oxidase-like deaminating enzyme
VPDLLPAPTDFSAAASPFPGHEVRWRSTMMFNLTEYQRVLMTDFLAAGGRIETREFHNPAEFAALPQKVLVNCTGYGARALLGDESVVPVRGQLARLIPQPDVHYGLTYDRVSLVPRRDGLVVQAFGPDESTGFDDDSTLPDRTEAEQAVATIARAFVTSRST